MPSFSSGGPQPVQNFDLRLYTMHELRNQNVSILIQLESVVQKTSEAILTIKSSSFFKFYLHKHLYHSHVIKHYLNCIFFILIYDMTLFNMRRWLVPTLTVNELYALRSIQAIRKNTEENKNEDDRQRSKTLEDKNAYTRVEFL